MRRKRSPVKRRSKNKNTPENGKKKVRFLRLFSFCFFPFFFPLFPFFPLVHSFSLFFPVLFFIFGFFLSAFLSLAFLGFSHQLVFYSLFPVFLSSFFRCYFFHPQKGMRGVRICFFYIPCFFLPGQTLASRHAFPPINCKNQFPTAPLSFSPIIFPFNSTLIHRI